ncbi:glycosyl transferase, family 2 [Desulforamulus reducens MI-1]|uniref:Glycosyl transferase, family 2 n=1 Tax=Desulforamulus reducens (strain ATCC BAA-1160 / DSM 100696 / MI-1) TaxID=349161 RepID=A4J4D5_DESRM|nr:TPR domain-containing glycosyltransferase [Desulforamulus reducens]ABO49938.1 glycosyl transferase, family 2 [Desulforamulus reducens MI-1]
MGNRISLCMIVKNEEGNIRRCLASVTGVVNEIIVVDTGSTDNTCKIAREMGARIYSFEWNNNFSDARNFSLAKATGDWILFLDADEELAGESREVLVKYVADEQVEGYFIKIINYLGKEGWTETCPDLVFRLFKNRSQYRFRGAIHEQIADVILEKNKQATYRIAEDIIIIHYGYLDSQIDQKDKKNRNLHIIQKEMVENPGNYLLKYHYGVELYRAERYGEAAEVLIQAANNTDSSTIYFPKLLRYIVLAYHSGGQPAKALDVIRQGLQLFPNYADLHYYGGLSLLQLKHYHKAVELFLQAVALPEQPPQYASFAGVRGFRSLYHLGEIAEVFLNYEEALRYYLESLRDNPGFQPALERIIKILKPRENPEYTRECLEKVLDFSSPQATLILSNIFFQQGAYKLTLEFLERLIRMGNSSAEILFRKSFCLIQERRFLEALRILNEYTADSYIYPLAKFNQILCFWVQGKKRKVRSLVQEIRTLEPAEDTESILRLLLRSQEKRKYVHRIFLGKDAVTLLLDIVGRLLYLSELTRVEELFSRVDPKCLGDRMLDIIRLYHEHGYYEKTVELLQEYIEANQNGEAHFLLAETHRELGDFIEADHHYRYAIELDPSQPRYYISQSKLYEDRSEKIKGEVPLE